LVVVSNKTKHECSVQTRSWTVGAKAISEGDNLTHLGVTCNSYSVLDTVIDGACRNLRGYLMGLFNIGLHQLGYILAHLSKYTSQVYYLVTCLVVS